jgi:predicted MPP superfamily phosphohydrolase
MGALMVGLYTWRVEPHWLEFTHPALTITGLPRELEGRTLAQLSDLHVGPKVDDDYIIESFRRVQEFAPDFVVYTGDWITYRSKGQFEQLRRVMAHAPHGRLGTVGILGNHDYGFGWQMPDVAEEVSKIVRDASVTVLRNEAKAIAGLQFLGLDDLWGPRFDPVDLLSQRGQDASTVVLCPRSVVDYCGSDACGPVYAAVPAATAFASKQQALHGWGDWIVREPASVHQPGRRASASSAFQCASGNPNFSTPARRLASLCSLGERRAHPWEAERFRAYRRALP